MKKHTNVLWYLTSYIAAALSYYFLVTPTTLNILTVGITLILISAIQAKGKIGKTNWIQIKGPSLTRE